MKALTWHGKSDMRCESVPDPRIEDLRDAIIKVTACAICGSDLHIYNGVIPEMEHGDILGHETMARSWKSVPTTGTEGRRPSGRAVHHFLRRVLLRVKKDFIRAASEAIPTRRSRGCGPFSAGLFGYSHLLGGYAGGQAEYLRVPRRRRPIQGTQWPSPTSRCFSFSDIFPTGYMAADFCNVQLEDTIAVWGCGPVGQFAIRSAFMLGAARVIAIDTVSDWRSRSQPAPSRSTSGGTTSTTASRSWTQGRGADARIDAVGTEPDATASLDPAIDRVKVATFLYRPAARAAPGHQQLPKLRHGLDRRRVRRLRRQPPMGSAVNRGLTFRMAQTPVQHYLPKP